jgi:lipopolysaccharide transport system ATP-binding protein
MASDVVIRAEGLGKKYVIGHQAERESYTLLRDVFGRTARGLARSARDLVSGRAMVAGDQVEEFWALKNLNFEIKRGEVVGIVGRNGAGKSTLLKILSRITEPSEGRVTIRGRVASLLEVGTGFHPELSGRENVYLNGAILGMSHAEIRRKFDEIVAFAEVEKFLDTPVKRYSSGMYVRLAFAVAAHLEPEILVVDEVLAVGDAEFQKKCLGKMQDVAGEGRTVLFVSHNMAALENICNLGILLSNHTVAKTDTITQVVAAYLTETVNVTAAFPPPSRPSDFHVQSVCAIDDDGAPVTDVYTWDRVRFRITFYAPRAIPEGAVTFQISTSGGQLLILSVTSPDHQTYVPFVEGVQTIDVVFDSLTLAAGEYILGAGLAVANTTWLYNEPYGNQLTVLPRDVFKSGYFPVATRYPIVLAHRWLRNADSKPRP